MMILFARNITVVVVVPHPNTSHIARCNLNTRESIPASVSARRAKIKKVRRCRPLEPQGSKRRECVCYTRSRSWVRGADTWSIGVPESPAILPIAPPSFGKRGGDPVASSSPTGSRFDSMALSRVARPPVARTAAPLLSLLAEQQKVHASRTSVYLYMNSF